MKLFDNSGPSEMPEPKGKGFQIVVYVDCDLGGDCVTKKSRTGFAVFLNSVPLYLVLQKQTSGEVSTFGSEFTAMKQALEYVQGL